MEMLFLGTGAGETWPAPFCMCRRCSAARRQGDLMLGASVLVDRKYLFDAPNGLAANMALLGITPRFPFHVFITHSHQDHFSPGELVSTVNDPRHRLTLYMSRTTRSLLNHYMRFNRFFDLKRHRNMRIRIVKPFQPFRIEKRVRLIPILASHDNTHNEEPLNYILKLPGRTILYACDTGWYSDRTWAEVLKHRFDAVVLECTFLATQTDGKTHLDYAHFLRFIDVLRNENCLADGAQITATHFNLHDFDGRKAAALRRRGIAVATRGMRCTC